MCIRDRVTPIARLTSEYNVYVVPANSPFKTMKDVVEQMKKDPGSVTWGCLLYTSDAADERSSVDLGGRRIIKKKKNKE